MKNYWLKNVIFYEIYPKSFYDSNGDGIKNLKGITQKLKYVRDLGRNGIWINPCFVQRFVTADTIHRIIKKLIQKLE